MRDMMQQDHSKTFCSSFCIILKQCAYQSENETVFPARALGFVQNKQRADLLQLAEDYPLMALNGMFQNISRQKQMISLWHIMTG